MKQIVLLFLMLFLLVSCSDDNTALEKEEEIIETPFVPQNVLFIGNSHTHFNQGIDFYLRGFLKNTSLPYDPLIERSAFDGFELDDHLENATTLSKLASKEWDIVVLQENTFKAANDKLGAKVGMERFKFTIKTDKTKLYLFLTWGYKDEPAMLANITETYEETGALLKAEVVPVGIAFKSLKDSQGDTIELYNLDGIHPSIEGSFLAASMFYYAIYKEDPTQNNYVASLDESTALLLKQTAKTVIDSY